MPYAFINMTMNCPLVSFASGLGLPKCTIARRQARFAVLLALVFGLLCSLVTSCESGLTADEKMADFRYLFEILRDN
jgi:hypothetical protein